MAPQSSRAPERPSEPSAASAPVEILEVTPQDWRSHRDLRLDMLRADPGALWADLAEVRGRTPEQWREEIRGPRRHLQARRGGQVLGGIAVLPGGYTPDHVVPEDQAQLVSLWVRSEARGQGIADLLVHGAAALARRLGRPELHLEVDAAQTPARALYARLGFRETGVVDPRPETGSSWVEYAARTESLVGP